MTATTERQATWRNWSGSVACDPAVIARPQSEEEIVALVQTAREQGRCVRPLGAGHSSSPLVVTDDIVVSLMDFAGLLGHDADGHEATLRPGTRLGDGRAALFEVGLAL